MKTSESFIGRGVEISICECEACGANMSFWGFAKPYTDPYDNENKGRGK
jgi:hypothetical protein